MIFEIFGQKKNNENLSSSNFFVFGPFLEQNDHIINRIFKSQKTTQEKIMKNDFENSFFCKNLNFVFVLSKRIKLYLEEIFK